MKVLETMRGMRVARNKSVCIAGLTAVMFCGAVVGQEAPPGVAGTWVTKLDNHIFLVVTLEAVPGSTGHFTGTWSRPQHFTINSGVAFSVITGPPVQESIVRSSVDGNCVSFTTQSPKDKNDETDLQLCQTGAGRGTLKINVLGIACPVIKEKGLVTVWTEWEAGRSYMPDDGYASNTEMERIFAEDQKVRQTDKIDWTVVEKADATRRVATRKL